MGKLLATAAMGIALSVPTFAFSGETKNETEQAAAETEQAVKEAEQTSEQAAAEVEQSAEEIVNEADQAASEAVEETEQAVNEAEQTAGEAVEETEQAAAEAEEGDGPGSDAVAADAEDAMVEGYAMVDASKMTAEELDGAAVYDTADEWIGEVSEIVLADDGKIETIVVDVGGFLGIGEKPVGLDYEKIKVLRGEDGGDLRVHVKSSKEELESMQEYEG